MHARPPGNFPSTLEDEAPELIDRDADDDSVSVDSSILSSPSDTEPPTLHRCHADDSNIESSTLGPDDDTLDGLSLSDDESVDTVPCNNFADDTA